VKRLVLTAPRRLEWAEAAPSRISQPTAAVVRPVAAATCDFDHLLVRGTMPLPLPIAIGHEFVAEVLEVGADVARVAPGDLVIVSFQVSCGTCDNCRRGFSSACRAVPWLSAYGLGALGGDWGGAVSDTVAVPWADAMLRRLPAGIAPQHAAAASCNIPDAYRAVVPQLRQRPRADVFITGGAFANISHYAVAFAHGLGARRIDYFSVDDEQSAKAERLGAHVVGSPSEVATEAYEVVVDNSQDPELLALAVRATAAAGLLTSTTMYPRPTTPVPLLAMFERGITFVTGQPHVSAHLDDVLSSLASGTLDPAAVTTAVRPWSEAAEAFGAGAGKVVCVRE